jgi:hypothetical protein
VQAVGDDEAGGVIQPRPDGVLDQAVVGRACTGVGSADIYCPRLDWVLLYGHFVHFWVTEKTPNKN